MEHHPVVDLAERRNRIRDESYGKGWENGVLYGLKEERRRAASRESAIHHDRMSAHALWFNVCLAVTLVLIALLLSDRLVRANTFLTLAIGAAGALTVIHAYKWDWHQARFFGRKSKK